MVVGTVLYAGIDVDAEKYGLHGIVGTRWELGGFLGILFGLFLVTRRTGRS